MLPHGRMSSGQWWSLYYQRELERRWVYWYLMAPVKAKTLQHLFLSHSYALIFQLARWDQIPHGSFDRSIFLERWAPQRFQIGNGTTSQNSDCREEGKYKQCVLKTKILSELSRETESTDCKSGSRALVGIQYERGRYTQIPLHRYHLTHLRVHL